MRVVLDTNVLLSGLLIANSPPAQLLAAWERNDLTVVTCAELIAEFRDVASRPFFKSRLRPSAVEQLAEDLRAFAQFIKTIPAASFSADPKDSFLLGLAQAGNADFLVTGDKALLRIKRYKGTRIVMPATADQLLAEQA